MARHSDDDIQTSEGDANAWLISYADMMTLIACFFILIVAFSNQEDPVFKEKAAKFAKYFRGSLVKESQEMIKRDEGENKREPTEEQQFYQEDIKDTPEEQSPAQMSQLNNIASISEISKPKSIEITFSGSIMFKEGSTEITEQVEKSIRVFIDLLKMRKSPFYILFEGHTDDTDVSTNVYPSNWELSTARASKILRMFESSGFKKDRLVAIGYGDTRPEYENRDKGGKQIPGNQKLNRRVEIKVITEGEISKDDLGLGIFWRDLKKKTNAK